METTQKHIEHAAVVAALSHRSIEISDILVIYQTDPNFLHLEAPAPARYFNFELTESVHINWNQYFFPNGAEKRVIGTIFMGSTEQPKVMQFNFNILFRKSKEC